MSYCLLLDDIREYNKDIKISDFDTSNLKIKTAKNYDEFINIIEKFGVPQIVSFDFDLFSDAYKEYSNAVQRGFVDYRNIQSKTGLHCAVWLKRYCISNKIDFPKYFVHSQNTFGTNNIKTFLSDGRLPITFQFD